MFWKAKGKGAHEKPDDGLGQRRPVKVADTGKWSEEKIEMMLSSQNKDKIRVKDALAGMEKPFTALLLIDPKEYAEVKSRVVEEFDENSSITYIALNSGYSALKNEFGKRGMKLKEAFFVDMVSVEAGSKPQKEPGVEYLSSPLDLTDCLLSIVKRLEETDGKALVIMDSVSTLLIYNNAASVEKFIHSMLGKVNAAGASALVFSAGTGERDSVTSTIGQFFGKIIRI